MIPASEPKRSRARRLLRWLASNAAGKLLAAQRERELSTVPFPPKTCGKATFNGFVEGRADGPRELPLPWDLTYKSAWQTSLAVLAARYESKAAFVSIEVAGPTASSEEMMMQLPKTQAAHPQ